MPGVSIADLAGLLRAVTGESSQWEAQLTQSSRLEDDLQLDSVELTALAELAQRRYGAAVDLLAYLRGLDLDELIALTVGDLVDHIRAAVAEAATQTAAVAEAAMQTTATQTAPTQTTATQTATERATAAQTAANPTASPEPSRPEPSRPEPSRPEPSR